LRRRLIGGVFCLLCEGDCITTMDKGDNEYNMKIYM